MKRSQEGLAEDGLLKAIQTEDQYNKSRFTGEQDGKRGGSLAIENSSSVHFRRGQIC
jgi:hypothetical protein